MWVPTRQWAVYGRGQRTGDGDCKITASHGTCGFPQWRHRARGEVVMLSTQGSRDEEEMGGVLYLTTLPGGLKERLRDQ